MSAQDALTFCRTLYGQVPIEFRIIQPKTGKVKHLWGWTKNEADLKPLTDANAEGYGIFAVVNRCHPTVEKRCKARKGARDDDITGIRAVFVDLDNETEPGSNLAKLEAAPLEPSLVICSSLPYKLQAYWLTKDMPIEDFELAQKALAAYFGSDPSISNLSRVMRVPGFYHTKGEPILARLLEAPGHAYTRAKLLEAFAIKLEPPKPTERFTTPFKLTTPANADQLRRYALAALQKEADTLAAMRENSGRNNRLNRAAYVLGGFIPHGLLTQDEIEDTLSDAACACGLEERELKSALRSGLSKAPRRDLPKLERMALFGSANRFGPLGGDQNLLPSISQKPHLGQSNTQRKPRLGGKPCL